MQKSYCSDFLLTLKTLLGRKKLDSRAWFEIGFPYLAKQRGEEQNREEGEMAQKKLGGGRNRGKKEGGGRNWLRK